VSQIQLNWRFWNIGYLEVSDSCIITGKVDLQHSVGTR
jgi:hypothetical protein